MAGETHIQRSLIVLALCASLGLFISTAIAGEAAQFDIVSLQAQRSMQVDNDLMLAVMGVEMDGKDTAVLAGKINNTMKWALDEAKNIPTVNVTSGNYYIYAVYDKTKISHWRASQTLNLKSTDVTAMTRLIGVLQNRLLTKSTGFGITPQKRDDVENELIGKALDAFKKRAEIVTGNLGAKGYKIVNIDIESPGSAVPPRPVIRAMAMESAASAPAVEPGMSDITIVVSGSIQMQ